MMKILQKSIRLSSLIFILCFLSMPVFLQSKSSNNYKVPKGKHILTDGKCLDSEWKDAKEIAIGKDFKLNYKKTKDFAFFCVKPPKEQMFSVDFYLSPANKKLYTFHVSAKLGERELKGEKWENWTADWAWWETNGWTANALRPNKFEEPSFFPHKAIEFQISRETYAGKKMVYYA